MLEKIKKLRQLTGVGILECQKVLKKTDYDIDKAVLELKKDNKSLFLKKNENLVKCGTVFFHISNDLKKYFLFKVCSETDFVIKSDKFKYVMNQILLCGFVNKVSNLDDLLSLYIDNESVSSMLEYLVLIYKEKIQIIDVSYNEINDGFFSYYNHNNKKLSIIFVKTNKSFNVVKYIAMQIVGFNIQYISWDNIPKDILLEEKKNILNKVIEKYKDKDDEKIHNIVEGMLKKYFDVYILLSQKFIKDNSLYVSDYLLKNDIDILNMYTYEVKLEN